VPPQQCWIGKQRLHVQLPSCTSGAQNPGGELSSSYCAAEGYERTCTCDTNELVAKDVPVHSERFTRAG
jgi:hypothetical protein